MSILDFLLNFVAPYDCLNCGTEGDLLCLMCAGELPPAPECCYRCKQPSVNLLLCCNCSSSSPLRRVYAATSYSTDAKSLIWQLKYNGAQSAASLMARQMIERIPLSEETVIIPSPTAATRVRQRGYDQAVLLARSLSRLTGLPCSAQLIRLGRAHQVGAGRSQRLSQLENSFRVRRPGQIKGAHVLLVDDVMTTGATLESAARLLMEAGAASVSAAVFAQAI